MAKPVLDYPFADVPAPGMAMDVASGVKWMRLPLPVALNHINVWGLADGPGWAVVDTGIGSAETQTLWRQLIAGALDGAPVTRVFGTHMHPDHIGMAGWLTRHSGGRLWMTQLEYLSCRMLASDTGRAAPPEALAFYTAAGWSTAALAGYQARFGNFGKYIQDMPDSYRRMVDGEVIRVGDKHWRVVVGNGHSPEHACLYCAEHQLLIAGDQVLPHISPNVSVYPSEPDANPMADWLHSLEKIKAQVPDEVLVLPAHGRCFRGLHARLDYLAASQVALLDSLLHSLHTPQRAVDVFATLFGRAIAESDGMVLGLATGESLACLNYLVQGARVHKHCDAHGVDWYQAMPGSAGVGGTGAEAT